MNIALAITLARIIFVPFLIFLLYLPNSSLWAAAFFALLSFTDWLDGYLARTKGLITDLGKFLDPLADKILVLSVLIVLAVQLRVDVFSVLLLVTREFTMTGFRTWAALSGKVIAASSLGKWKTATQMVALGLIIAEWPFGLVLYYVSVGLALISLIEYLWVNRAVMKG